MAIATPPQAERGSPMLAARQNMRTVAAPYGRLRLAAVLLALAVTTSLFLTRNIDFRVYWYGASRLFQRGQALYGPASGFGFPMHYRYSPITYFILWPLSRLPLCWAGSLWMLGAWAASTAAVATAVRRLRLRFTRTALAAAVAFLLAYAVLAIRSGNVQPYVIAMILSALVLSESRPAVSGGLMALAIVFKVWPLFFLPWFLRRGRRAVLLWLLAELILLWLVPLFAWSPSHYLDLTREWYRSEMQTAVTSSELWYFPGQSLRGVLLRYVTDTPHWLAGFPDVHFLNLAPAEAVRIWAGIAIASYCGVCFAMLQSDRPPRWVWDGASFALFSLLQPFALKSSLISLGPAALIGAALFSGWSRARVSPYDPAARRCFLAACLLSLFGAIAQPRPLLRLLLVVGLDFWAAAALFAALLLWALPAGCLRSRMKCKTGAPSRQRSTEACPPTGRRKRMK